MAINPTIQNELAEAFHRHQNGQLEEARAGYQTILSREPGHPDALHLLGYLLHQLGMSDSGVELIRQAIAVNPHHPTYPNTLGAVLAQSGKLEEAIVAFRKTVTLQPASFDAHNNLGNALQAFGRLSEAIDAYRQALSLQPQSPVVLCNLGAALREQGQFEEAINVCRKALTLDPSNPLAHNNIALALQKVGRLDEAVAEFRQVIALQPVFPDAHMNLGIALTEQGALDDAIATFQQALSLSPSAEVLTNMAFALIAKGLRRDGEAALVQSLNLKPNFAAARYALASLHLSEGRFEQGWKDYEARWSVKGWEYPLPHTSCPRWMGELLEGQRVFLNTEQGLGDTIQFARYVPLVARRGGKVLLESPPHLRRLFQGIEGITELSIRGGSMPEFDIYCPLMSLPFVLGTTLDTIPAEVPYLHPDLADIERWRNRFTPDDRRLRVGLVWGGNPAHRNERNRSIMLRMLTPIGGDPRVAFYSLQKGPPAAQAADAKKFGIDLTDWTAELNDFADTAALIHHLDLVITVDTSVAHLAGALAKPTWVLLPTPADFRWMLERSDSPWYPTMRLFRQPRPRDWETPIQKVAAELRSLAARSVHHVGGE